MGPVTGYSQSVPATDSLLLSTSLGQTLEVYSSTLGIQSHLYNGVRYREFATKPSDRGIPYFETTEWVTGSLFYDGELHDNIPILYDIVRDKVIIPHGPGGIKVQLINQKLKYFTLPGHRFVNVLGDSLKMIPLQAGFYDLLSDGKARFLVKWHKEHLEPVDEREIKSVFMDNNTLYIWKEGVYYTVKSKAEVLKVLGDRKNLRKFIRKNRIRFRVNRVQAVARVVGYFNDAVK